AEFSVLHDLEPGDTDPFVENLVGATAQHPAGIRRVGASSGPGDQIAAIKDWLDYHHVVGVRSGDVGIVEKKLVAVVKARCFAEPLHQASNRIGSRRGEAQMSGAGENHGAFFVIERTHTLAALRNDGRGGYALQGHASFFANGPQSV